VCLYVKSLLNSYYIILLTFFSLSLYLLYFTYRKYYIYNLNWINLMAHVGRLSHINRLLHNSWINLTSVRLKWMWVCYCRFARVHVLRSTRENLARWMQSAAISCATVTALCLFAVRFRFRFLLRVPSRNNVSRAIVLRERKRSNSSFELQESNATSECHAYWYAYW